MARKVRAYTKIGKRISTLGKRQRELARVLQVSQQTISKKLRGETAILLSDFEKLAKHYKVPITYFCEEDPGRPDLAAACERLRGGPAPLQDLVVMLSSLPAVDVERVLEITRVMAKSDSSRPRRAAEEKAPYGKK